MSRRAAWIGEYFQCERSFCTLVRSVHHELLSQLTARSYYFCCLQILNSHNGVLLLKCLRRLADSGCSILVSIHHPTQIMFESFNHVMVIHAGRTMFQCDVADVPRYFADRDLPIPKTENPADWMLAVSQTYSVNELKEFGFFSSHTDQKGVLRSTMGFEEGFEKELDEGFEDNLPLANGTTQIVHKMMTDEPTSFWMEFKLLFWREVLRTSRDKTSFFARLATTVCCGGTAAIVFQGVVDKKVDSLLDFVSHIGAVFLFLFTGYIISPSIVLDFLDRRSMFEREYRTGHYRIWSYSLVAIVDEFFISTFQGGSLFLIVFWAVGFQGRAWYQLLVYVANVWTIANFFIFFTSITRNRNVSDRLLGLGMYPVLVWCGFYITISKIPSWIQWPSWLMPLFYTFRLFIEDELDFCGDPKGRDKHLMDCIMGLEGVLINEIMYGNESKFSLTQTGIYKGDSGIREYSSLFSGASTQNNEILYDTCLLKDQFKMRVNEVSPTVCDITVASVLRGIWNDRLISGSDVGHQSVFGYRLKYQPRNNGAVHISEQHAFWINPFQDVYPVWKNLAEDICGTLKNSCKARHFEPFTDLENCITSMNTLPLSETNIWGINSYQGNSTMCRRVHTFMAKINPEIHCPHLSWYSEEDVNGNYKCDPKYLNQIFYHWTKQELNLFEEVGKAMGLPEISLAKNVAVEDIGECISDPVAELTRAIIISDELENLDFQCYNYLLAFDATQDNQALYWGLLFTISVAYRLLSIFFLRHNALTQN